MFTVGRLFVLFLLLLPLVGFGPSAAAAGKFAIAADGDQLDAKIAKLAGIAPFFHIYDANGNLLEVLANPHLELETGTGPACATTLADRGVGVLVARRIPGPKMDDVLRARDVRLVRRMGVVRDVVDELKE
uniref:Predicted Fe-Mo cluster-binding protein, NifX family n=1 Tax=Candidatus Kentrum eta TaxID=2126337 RepID=A0A450U7S4_9GAMM|nr:MAG: Predicted Fe-Mo cluster-binding protein, NifX family [Candidatus Kentron sp. H]VFJ89536.1 MAG: Predicted Fe-Mo cluster-binding protein, NifX family [Candidatus Kentron sp. H]VFJ96225.1 MAG: Predicted Fe-Mo cluster-binding protein, NifX family [Candidatus Kentron sp. H]